MEVFWLIVWLTTNIFQNGVDALAKIGRLFVKKAQDFIWFGLSDDVHILLARATNTFKELQNAFQTSDVNICNGNMKYPNRNNDFSHWILRSRSSMFPLLLLTVEVKILFVIP